MSQWIVWMQRVQAIAQTGLHYSNTPFDKERYEHLLEIATEIGSHHSEVSAEDLKQVFLQQTGYATPRVDVRAACFQNDKILLVQEKADGCWALPGGWADVGDSPSNAAVREVVEESGYTAVAKKLIAVFDANRSAGQLPLFHAYKLVFLCEIQGEPTPLDSPEILAVDFFSLDELPPLSTNRTWKELVEECFAHHQNAERPPYFD